MKQYFSLVWILLAVVAGYLVVSQLKKAPPPQANPATNAASHPTPKKDTEPKVFHSSQKVMGSLAEITIATDDEALAKKSFDVCFAEMQRLDMLLTTWVETSDTSKINAAAGVAPVAVQPDTFFILKEALSFSTMTEGLFDVTVGAFSGLWKFDQDKDGTLPTKEQVEERLALVGYRDLLLDEAKQTAFLQRPKMRITLGGIGKGFAVDRCVEMFRKSGLKNFLVQSGGDLYVAGEKAPGKPWRVGIRDPRGPEDAVFASFEIRDRSFSTSGDYERFVLRDGVRYHHILDPRTGFPAEASMSATVSAKDATTAEGLSKAFFLWGPEITKQKIESGIFGDVGAVVVDRKGHVYITEKLRTGEIGKEVFINKPTTD
jgi:thiamine biosynthesis lipoprotein